MPRLTVKAIEAAKPKTSEYKLTVDRGLYLRVATDGTKTWLVRYVVGGRQRQARLPEPYGSAGAGFMTLAAAGAENARIQALARDGIDFQEQAASERAAQSAEAARAAAENLPVQKMFEAWLQDGVARIDGNAELRRAFEKDVLPKIGTKPVKTVSEHDLRLVLRAMVKRGVHRMAVRTYNDLVQMFAWAEKRQPWRGLMADGNPAELVEIDKVLPAGVPVGEARDRVLLPEEIRELHTIFTTMEADYANTPAGKKYGAIRPLQKESQLAIWLCLSTACRIGELLMAEWRHVDLEKAVWFIPKENTKRTRGEMQDHTVFLSDFALCQFKTLHELTGKFEWCFPARHQDGHVCVKSVSKQIGDRQCRFKTRKPLKNRRHDDTLVLADGKRGEWTPHDMRRTAATMMQALRVSPDVIDRCQNHVMAAEPCCRP